MHRRGGEVVDAERGGALRKRNMRSVARGVDADVVGCLQNPSRQYGGLLRSLSMGSWNADATTSSRSV